MMVKGLEGFSRGGFEYSVLRVNECAREGIVMSEAEQGGEMIIMNRYGCPQDVQNGQKLACSQ